LEVSVVIPAYNRPAMLRRALESVAAQSPAPAAEVIVVDDGSTEDLEGVAGEYDVRLIRHAENRGLSAARNTGVGAAAYPWVALLDSDDEWLPHHLETLWPLRAGHLLVASSAFRCGSDPRKDRVQGTLRRSPVVLSSPAGLLYPDNFICPSAVMVRRDAILAAGGFESRQGVVEDLLLWCRLLDRGTGVASPTVSLRYHIHDEQMTSDFERMHAAHLMVAESFADREWWSPAIMERRRGHAAWARFREYAARGERRAALRAASGVIGHPQRVIGVVGTWVYRLLRRRHTSRVQRDGLPSIAVLGESSGEPARALDALQPLPVSDWRNVGLLRALVRLARRPRAIVIVDSTLRYVLVRLAGVRPVRASAVARLGARANGPMGRP
jgi:glycosyltransferase involved in cell wall biosynthesis